MKKTLIAIALAAVVPALMTLAQPGPGGPGRPRGEGGPGGDGHRPMPPLVKALDANGDGVIDADEIANASAALKSLDKNDDGKLTAEELRPARPEGAPPGEGGGKDGARPRGRGPRPDGEGPGVGGPPPDGGPGHGPDGAQGPDGKRPLPPLMKALDANGDGVIDAKEIAGAKAALKKLDKNGDGKLSLDELRPPRPQQPPSDQ